MSLQSRLSPFARRVRFVRAWQGLAYGLIAGGAAGAVWATADWAGWLDATPVSLATLLVGSGAIGALVGAFRPIAELALSRSIDFRAGLEDRLGAAVGRENSEHPFEQAIVADAESHLDGVQPARVYPIHVGRLQAAAVGTCLLAASLFLLGNTPLLKGESVRKDHAELQKKADDVEHVVADFQKPIDGAPLNESEKKFADELRRLQHDLRKDRLGKEEAMQKANELAQQAERLMQQSADRSAQSSQTALDSLEKMDAEAMQQAGMNPSDPSASGDSQRIQKSLQANKSAQQQSQKQLDAIKKRLDEIKRQLNRKDLSAAERAKLQREQQELEKQADELSKQLSQLKNAELQLSKEAQAIFDRMRKDPIFKELQALARKMQKNAKAAQQGRKQLTKEQVEQMRRRMEELAKQLKDPKAMQAYLKAMLEAMKNAQACDRDGNACNGMNPGMQGLGPSPEVGAPGNGVMVNDTGKINKKDKPVPSAGKTHEEVIQGERGEQGEETYMEIKAPTTVGDRTSVPYTKVLPSYKRKAEAAINRSKIPKEHEKRVRQYFESLGQR